MCVTILNLMYWWKEVCLCLHQHYIISKFDLVEINTHVCHERRILFQNVRPLSSCFIYRAVLLIIFVRQQFLCEKEMCLCSSSKQFLAELVIHCDFMVRKDCVLSLSKDVLCLENGLALNFDVKDLHISGLYVEFTCI